MQSVLKEKSYPEPRMVIFKGTKDLQAFIVAEQDILFEATDFTTIGGIVSLLASYYVYYVKYPKPIPAYSLLLFMQEHLLEQPEVSVRKPARYSALVNTLL